MLRGTSFHLRPITEADLPVFERQMMTVDNRGDYYPHMIFSPVEIRRQFEAHGYWKEHSGILLIVNDAGTIIGQIEFFEVVDYWSAYEISYLLYEQAERGKGIVTEAVNLLVRYLFENMTVNRLQLAIHPENAPSLRVAEKCGFTHEGTARGAWYNKGIYHDMEIFSILRGEVLG
jgi:ribosomal-protein-alanine N-acetyltransferase